LLRTVIFHSSPCLWRALRLCLFSRTAVNEVRPRLGVVDPPSTCRCPAIASRPGAHAVTQCSAQIGAFTGLYGRIGSLWGRRKIDAEKILPVSRLAYLSHSGAGGAGEELSANAGNKADESHGGHTMDENLIGRRLSENAQKASKMQPFSLPRREVAISSVANLPYLRPSGPIRLPLFPLTP